MVSINIIYLKIFHLVIKSHHSLKAFIESTFDKIFSSGISYSAFLINI